MAGENSKVWNSKYLKFDRYHDRIKAIENVLKHEVDPSKKTDVLEVGASNDQILLVLFDYLQDFTYTGIDISTDAIGCLSNKYLKHRNISFVYGDVKQCLRDIYDNFDLVIISGVFEYLDNPFPILKETSGLLNNDGLIIYSYINPRYPFLVRHPLWELDTAFFQMSADDFKNIPIIGNIYNNFLSRVYSLTVRVLSIFLAYPQYIFFFRKVKKRDL